MKNRSYLISGLIVVALLILARWLWQVRQTPSPAKSTWLNLQINNNSSGSSPVNSVKIVPTPSSWVNKVVAMKEIWAGENAKSMDTYGKVVDQYGSPVAGAKVKAGVGLVVDFTHSGGEDHYTETDSQGRFSFIGIHGAGVGFTLQKEGYEYNQRLPSSSRPENYSPDPDHPIIFKMWKLKGAEPMTFARVHAYIPCDGSAASFNLLTGKRGTDMVVKLTRNPVNIIRGKPFDWTVTLEIANGGFVEQADAYPNEAPVEGYKPSITINMPANMQNWTEDLSQSFYFKSRGEQNYGRMTIKINAAFQPPPTSFNADIYTNPAGSRNLEYDSTKQIEVN